MTSGRLCRYSSVTLLADMKKSAVPDGDQPWQQQPGEGDRDFNAFKFFLADWTYSRIAREDGRSRTRIYAISDRWRWEARAAAYRERTRDLPEQLLPEDAATVLIDNAMSEAQASQALSEAQSLHLQKISDYQARAERLGNAQIAISGQLLQIVQQRIVYYRDHGAKDLNVESLIRAATMAAATGHKLMGDALGIEELFLTMQQHMDQTDLARLPMASSRTT